MAEETFELQVTPEVTKSSEVDPRRHSTGRQTHRTNEEKVLPNYLRASTGSCHDFCKYGRKHASDEKERQSVPTRVPRKPLGQSSKESVGGTKKTSEVKVKAPLDSEPQFPDTSDANKNELLTKSIDSQKLENEVLVNRNTGSEESFGGTKKTSVTNPRESLDSKPCISDHSGSNKLGISLPTKSADSQKQAVKEVRISGKKTSSAESVDMTKKTTVVKLRASCDSSPQISDNSDTSKQKMLAKSLDISKLVENEVLVNRRKTPPVKVKPSSHPRSQASDVTNSMRRKVSSTSEKVETSTKVAPLETIKMKLSAKHASSSKPKAVPVRMASSENLSEGSDCQIKNKLKMGRLAASTKVAAKKLQTPSKASLTPRPLNRVPSINSKRNKGLKIVSCLKNQSNSRKVGPKPQRNNEFEEKTLYVTETEGESKTLQSDQNGSHEVESSLSKSPSSTKPLTTSISQSSSPEDPEESEYATSEAEEDVSSVNSEPEHLENGQCSDEDGKGKPSEDGIICSEDKDIQMAKLKFKRGKVVETQSEKSSPRRLKFQRGKVFGDNPNFKAEALRKNFKREGTDAENTGATPGPEAVVLRHQDVEDKKDALGLFNNVIEETASKLAETRKSKVKALVGAFETVISLQERKPSANSLLMF